MSPSLYLWVLRLAAGAVGAAGLLAAARGRGRLGLCALPLLLAGLPEVLRTAQAGHLPLAGLHETLLTFGFCLAAVSTLACVGAGVWRAYGLGLCLAGLFLGLASVTPVRPTPLVPALQTLWFEVHVASSFLAYACFGVAACAGAVRLAGASTGGERGVLEGATRWGFAWFTWAMVSGGVWAYLAWGAYWLWHVKELWSGILWTFYAGAVHLPHTPGWSGRHQDAASVVGFALVLVTYLGVGILMRNTHQF